LAVEAQLAQDLFVLQQQMIASSRRLNRPDQCADE
jgi:hypothetical protein